MSKPVHSKNEILRSNTGLTINPSKAYSRSETRDKLTGLTIIQGGLFRQSQAIKNRFPSRVTGTPRLDEHMLIVFCMLLVSSVQVKHQGSDQSLRLSVSIPSRSSIKDPIRVYGYQVKHQGSDQSPRLSVSIPSRSSFKVQVKVHGFQYPIHPGKASMFRSPSYGHSFYLLLVSAIQVKCQGPDFPAMGIAIDVRRQGCDLPAKCSVIQANQQDSDLPSMVIDLIYLQSPAIQVKHQGSDLPAMVIAIQVKRQGADLPFYGYRPNSKDQNSNLGYSSNIKDLISNQGYGYTHFSLSLHAFFRIGLVCLRSGYTMKNLFFFQCDRYIHLVRPLVTVGFISILASQSKPAIMDPISVQCYSVLAVKVPLLSMPMIPNPSPIQSDRATIKDPISIQYDSVFTAQVEEQGFLLHPRLQPRPIDPGLLSSSLTIFLQERPTINMCCLSGGNRYTNLPKNLLTIYLHNAFTSQANDQSFDILLGSQPFLLRSKRSMLSSTLKVSVHAENQGCTSKNRVKSTRRKGQQSRCHSPSWMLGIPGFFGIYLLPAVARRSVHNRGQHPKFHSPCRVTVHTDGQVSAIRRVHTKDQYFSLHPGSQTFKYIFPFKTAGCYCLFLLIYRARDKLPTLNHEPQYSKSESNDQASAFRQGLKISKYL
ncbi:hypothetical protein F4703DRAFT_1793958 [Phycomyces blakesleeanus]